MAQDRVVFLPWTDAQCAGMKAFYEENHTDRAQTHHKRKWTIITMDTPGKPLEKLGLGVGTRLHVWGHGGVNDPTIEADDHSEEIDSAEVVKRMIAKGFKKHYLGTIVADSCYSALGATPFAKRLARELWSQGVKASCVLGYKGSLYIMYSDETKPGGKYTHRGVELANGTEVKSKDAQERFFGWT
jgi:hypothetical protein